MGKRHAIDQCNLKERIKVITKSEQNQNLPEKLYLFAYVGDRQLIVFDDSSVCQEGFKDGFHIINFDDVVRVDLITR